MSTQTALSVLDRHYLEIRCELLNLAASLDRIDGADDVEATRGDERLRLIAEGLKIVSGPAANRAEQLQLLLSDPYVEGWNQK